MVAPTPFGRWPSPLEPAAVAAHRRARSALASDGRSLYWVERRPEEGGRQVVVRAEVGAPPSDATPPGTSARSRVHEYGGGVFCLVPGEPAVVAFVEQADQRVHLVRPDGSTVPCTPLPPAGERWAHGDLRATPDGRWVLCVRERHVPGPPAVVRRELVAYPAGPTAAAPGAGTVLAAGHHFYAAPRPDPGGGRLAWTCWDPPDMPWDAAELWVADLVAGEGTLTARDPQRVDGGREGAGVGADGADRADGADGADGVSVGQPTWDVRGHLVYVSDRSGWWLPWRWEPGGGSSPLVADAADYHGPDWALGQATIAEVPGGLLGCRRRREGTDRLVLLDADAGTWQTLDQPCVSVSATCSHGGGLAWLGATPAEEAAPWWCPVPAVAAPGGVPGTGAPRAGPPVRAVATPPLLDDGDIALAEPFTCTGRGGQPVHGLFYPPCRAGVAGPPGARPPLVVHCHGGPTGAAEPGFDPVVQLLTTRGFAVAAVDYAGSTGYGRDYRRALGGRWGEADVDDCVDAARSLAAEGRVDGRRMAIRGSSAGGLTALGALVRSDAFAGAVAWYGVTDLLALAAATHDFEAHYTEWLVGPLPAAADEYRRRSPSHRTADVRGAVLLLQGLDDPVVPPAQATAMAEALQAQGLPCELVTFPGESHGFRRAETVERSLRAELDFYVDRLCGP